MDKYKYERHKIEYFAAVIAIPFVLVFAFIFAYGTSFNKVKFAYSNYQKVDCIKNVCKVKYYKDSDYLCFTDANISVSDNYESKNTRVYYNTDFYSDNHCSFKLSGAMPYFRIELAFMAVFFTVIAIIVVDLIKDYLCYRRYYKSIIHFETHRPILIENIKYRSKKRIKNRDEISPAYSHNINTNVEIPGYGITNIKGIVTSDDNEISSISVVIDPNDVRYYIITDDRHLRREYDLFIEEHFGDKIDRS